MRFLRSSMLPRHPSPTPFPYTTLFRSMPGHQPYARKTAVKPRHGPVLAQVMDTPTVEAHDDVARATSSWRSEEHTSELQSHHDLVCRLLLEKKKKIGAITAEGAQRVVR